MNPCNDRAPARRVAMAAALVAFLSLALASACGGGNDAMTAKSLIPDLGELDLEVQEEGRDPYASPAQDTYRALYASTDGSARAAVVVLYVQSDVAEAEAGYAQLAKALENPPAEFFGADADQAEAEALSLGDERRAFVTAQADSQGNRVWTDVYRLGRVVAITQVLSPEDADHAFLRQAIAEAILRKVK